MTNGHDNSSGMSSCDRNVHENAAKAKKRPQAPRPAVSRDNPKTDAVAAQASTPGQ